MKKHRFLISELQEFGFMATTDAINVIKEQDQLLEAARKVLSRVIYFDPDTKKANVVIGDHVDAKKLNVVLKRLNDYLK